MGSALLNRPPAELLCAVPPRQAATASLDAGPASPEDLRLQLAQRLAAHRTRRARLRSAPQRFSVAAQSASQLPGPRAARIAAVVAERYANSPTYRAVLAAEAERALQQAQASAQAAAQIAAQIAARNPPAIQPANRELLDTCNEAGLEPLAQLPAPAVERSNDLPAATAAAVDLEREPSAQGPLKPGPEKVEQGNATPAVDRARGRAQSPGGSGGSSARARANRVSSTEAPAKPTAARTTPVGLTVHLYEAALDISQLPAGPIATNRPAPHAMASSLEALALETLDREIAFRQSPVFEEPAGPPTPIPANLIEFPRQLVASRKARPRYAEGPLREEDVPAPGDAQLRIFEVETAQIATTPGPAETASPQWTSIWLDAPNPMPPSSSFDPAELPMQEDRSATHDPRTAPCSYPRPHPAPISRRVRAAAIDAAFVFTGFLAFGAASLAASASVAHASLTQVLLHAVTGPALQPPLALAATAATLAAFYLLYQALFFSLSEATPGMRASRIAFCTFADENPTRRAIRRRALALLVSILPFGLGLLWAALDDDRLAWHDRLTRIYPRSY